jgi:hypothetical protein
MVYLYKLDLATVKNFHQVIFDIFVIKPTKMRFELLHVSSLHQHEAENVVWIVSMQITPTQDGQHIFI